MPLYEYKCQACGTVFETLQKFSDPPLEIHQNCGGRLERLISPPAFQFKGSGWYITDYGRSGNGANGRQEKAKPKTDAGTKSETKSDAKPADSSSKS